MRRQRYNLRLRPVSALIWTLFGSTGNAPDYSIAVIVEYWDAILATGETL